MKQVFWVVVLFQVMQQRTEFILQTIENRSDLHFNRAYYKQLDKEKTLPTLTDLLQKSNSKHHVVIDKKVGSDGLALAMSDDQGHKATIFLHGQPKHSIEFKRKKTKRISTFPDIVATGTGSYTAQIMMEDLVDKKMLAEPHAYNYQEPASFNLIISGAHGSYQISLHATAE